MKISSSLDLTPVSPSREAVSPCIWLITSTSPNVTLAMPLIFQDQPHLLTSHNRKWGSAPLFCRSESWSGSRSVTFPRPHSDNLGLRSEFFFFFFLSFSAFSHTHACLRATAKAVRALEAELQQDFNFRSLDSDASGYVTLRKPFLSLSFLIYKIGTF